MKDMGNANGKVEVMVIGCVDYDGSFLKRAAKYLFEVLERRKDGLTERYIFSLSLFICIHQIYLSYLLSSRQFLEIYFN